MSDDAHLAGKVVWFGLDQEWVGRSEEEIEVSGEKNREKSPDLFLRYQ
jgi:hypothetical protein